MSFLNYFSRETAKVGDWDLVKGLTWSAHSPDMEDHDGEQN